jgi:hypothetical protein
MAAANLLYVFSMMLHVYAWQCRAQASFPFDNEDASGTAAPIPPGTSSWRGSGSPESEIDSELVSDAIYLPSHAGVNQSSTNISEVPASWARTQAERDAEVARHHNLKKTRKNRRQLQVNNVQGKIRCLSYPR